MKTSRIITTALVAGTAFVYATMLRDQSTEDPIQGPMLESAFGYGKTSVHLPGCRTFHPPAPPKTYYPTVTRNFMTRLCALEVYPPLLAEMPRTLNNKQAAP